MRNGVMVKDILELKLRLAYLNFRKEAAIIFSIWTLAFIAGIGLIIASEFIYNNIEIKIFAVVLALLLFARIIYDVWKDVRLEYEKRFDGYSRVLRKIKNNP